MDKNVQVYNYMETFFCCEVRGERFCEEMVAEHMLVYICSGELELQTRKGQRYHLKKGNAFFLQRDHKMTKIKKPSPSGEPFKGLFLQLKTPFLRKLQSEYRLYQNQKCLRPSSPYLLLPDHPFLKALFLSLEIYFEAKEYPSEQLMEAKLKEAVFTLLQLKPELASILFEFKNEWKIDLVEFMNENYLSDLDLEGFAHFAGRSLTAFKKDFREAFGTSPRRWIMERRLKEGKRLIEEEGLKPIDVYGQVGFKTLSHFSTAYKKCFGYPPSAEGV
ncbi:MAG: helix-turn-helix domain-containing protein [Bacteroidaceae bacterium]|nr:helix-turn-helix domain-containing protein [Bacteroidaceae bacterium]